MNWYLTWQDGVAVLLAVMGLGFAWWLHRKFATPHGCGRCPMLENTPTKAAPGAVSQGGDRPSDPDQERQA